MKVIQYICIFLVTSTAMLAQPKHDYIWIFSGNTDQTLPNSEGSIIDFNGTKVDTYYKETIHSIGSNNISFSSYEGDLLAYANGCDIFNSDFVIMENGEDINPGEVHDAQCVIDHYPGTQNSLMLPDPGGNGIYYYHKSIENVQYPEGLVISGFEVNYSYIDNSTNEVTSKNISLHERGQHISSFTEAIQHANGEDWWILEFAEWDSLQMSNGDSLMYVFKVDKDSIYFHHEQEMSNASVLYSDCSVAGQSAFSTDGQTFAMYCPLSGLDLYDFDRETALISNHRNLQIPADYRVSGLCFSPNNRFVYVSNGSVLWQVDLEAPSLEDGLLLIDEYDQGPGFPATFAKMQLGPDCRIYMNSTNSTPTLHIINHPDEKGEACGFVQRGFELPHFCRPTSLPNFPHFRIDEDEICNPDLVASVFEFPVKVVKGLDVYPNPTSGELAIELPEVMRGRLSVRDVTGQIVLGADIARLTEMQLDLSGYDSGMYMIEVVSDDGDRYVERVFVF